MDSNLLEKTVNELMKKFGAGNHKPGSGSAAAFQCMISAKLISTVISLTADEKRKPYYDHCLTELLDFQDDIENRIYPQLATLFQMDSDQFGKTIQMREERDKATDITIINQMRRQALEELKVSIAIPLEIAKLSIELSNIGEYVFDMGFQSARGDSQVGLSGSISALAGCIAIIRLNILSFNSDEYEYTKSIVEEVSKLDVEYRRLSLTADSKMDILKKEYDAKIPLFDGISKVFAKYRENQNVNIEECVRDLQNLVWTHRKLIWKKTIPKNPLEVLRPDVILRQALGYDYFLNSAFGVPTEFGEIIEIGGLIDQKNKIVVVSNEFSKEVQNFTAAHELGHAILHNKPILHRDIPADFGEKRLNRDSTEIAADKFASSFLMPTNLVSKYFHNNFSLNKFTIDENSSFGFGGITMGELRHECVNVRGLARKLASCDRYNNKDFSSLASTFNVSIEAMAIRLEELGLVSF